MNHTWINEFDGSVTVCDTNGIILEMNQKAQKTFERDLGTSFVGKSLIDCHPEPAKSKLIQMLETQEKNVYTIEKKGIKKLIYQTPWYDNGIYSGFVEMSIEIPFEMPHFIRKTT